MPEGLQFGRDEGGNEADALAVDVAACRTCPGRVVFIESDNTDGWIATDATVEVSP